MGPDPKSWPFDGSHFDEFWAFRNGGTMTEKSTSQLPMVGGWKFETEKHGRIAAETRQEISINLGQYAELRGSSNEIYIGLQPLCDVTEKMMRIGSSKTRLTLQCHQSQMLHV